MPTAKRRVAQRRALRWAQGNLCAGCGRALPAAKRLGLRHPDYPTFDHVIPKSEGGGRTLVNGLLKHLRCNQARGNRPPTGCDLIWHDLVQLRLSRRPRSFKSAFAGGAYNPDNKPIKSMANMHRKGDMSETAAKRLREDNRARLRRSVLSQCVTVGDSEAWRLLGQQDGEAAERLNEMASNRDIFRLIEDGTPVYPAFQFDSARQSVLQGIRDLLRVKPADYSEYQLLHWLTRPHLEFDGPPMDAIGHEPDAVLRAFLREIEPITHE